MRLLPLYILASIVLCVSCDGKHRAHKTNKEIFESSNLSTSFFEIDRYFPEGYEETVSDSTLSNGFRVAIKFFSNMEKNIVFNRVKDTLNYTDHYREFESQVNIEYRSKPIFNQLINKEFLVKENVTTFNKLEHLRLENLYIEEFGSSDAIEIDLLYSDVNGVDVDIIHVKLLVDYLGSYSIREVKPIDI